ncbi:hypothetical protein PAXRUDRAFT_164450 [Paxillus rubicundulus Ve08.2h10]|uniref:Uncharacterized protein n=1 Tax=Paxillus rubicundulus Ve08.2h10 TaxID=930991 RepID=A0A0D0DJE2_9AGAM|nr:hypothetical protein PAXRUDRAFT_164450 [Paxillus rubicundulus Ve08.2h10]
MCGQISHGKCCTNCVCLGHASIGHFAEECFHDGGRCVGQRETVLAEQVAKHRKSSTATAPPAKSPAQKGPASTNKPGAVHYASNGCAYFIDPDTNEAFLFASDSPTEPMHEFAGLESETLTPAFLRSLPIVNNGGYDALMASLKPAKVSLDWQTHFRSVNFAGLTYKAPNQHQATVVDPSIVPFFLDSSTSVHVSNNEADFYQLCPIPPCGIDGVGSSSIQAVGVGTL